MDLNSFLISWGGGYSPLLAAGFLLLADLDMYPII